MSLHSYDTQREGPVVARRPRVEEAATAARPAAGAQAGFRLAGFRPSRAMLATGGVLVILALAGAYVATRSPAPPAAAGANGSSLTVTVSPVTRVAIARSLAVTGSLKAFDELPLGTETAGIMIKEVLVDEGDHVTAGQVLARFNDDLLRADLVQKEASLREAEANAAEGQANIRRAEELLKTGAISVRDADNRRALAATAEARVGVARANLEQSRARLRQADIRAPVSGVITYRGARVGAVMSAGGPELFRLLRDSRIELAAEVPERDLAEVKVGQPVALAVDTGTGPRAFQGVVRLISPVVDPKTRIGTVKIDVPTDPGLRSGMFVHGRIEVGEVTGLTVPELAVVYQAGRPVLFTVDAENKAHARIIETGARGNGRVAVTGDLAEGDKVVVSGAGYLKEGDPVVVSEAASDVGVKPIPKLF